MCLEHYFDPPALLVRAVEGLMRCRFEILVIAKKQNILYWKNLHGQVEVDGEAVHHTDLERFYTFQNILEFDFIFV